MNTKKKISTFILILAMVLSFVPTLNVKAANSDFKIISETKVTAKQAGQWAKSKGATDTFISLAELYWKYAPEHGNVNPGIAYVQAAKETGYGKFGGVLNDSYHNPCGLKKTSGGDDTDPNAHQKFDSWDLGVQAHLDHLALYAGANGYPRITTNDPRHFSTIKGKATKVNALGGNWAPSVIYGEEVNTLYISLLNFEGIEHEDGINNDYNNSNADTHVENNNISLNQVTATKTQVPQEGISAYKVQDQNNAEDEKINITSTIGWKNEKEVWYYYKSDNTKAIGWIKPDKNWYYLREDGKMAVGWVCLNGLWYYLNESGAMVKGWKVIDEKWYFLSNSGAMITGWVEYESNYYYLEPSSGKMLTNTHIDGYNILADGKRGNALVSIKNLSVSNKTKSTVDTNNSKPLQNAKYKGIDISHYNGNIDFYNVKSYGIQCIYMKATEGTTYIDPYLENYYSGSKNAGLKTGFYHFLVGTSSPETQAENFYNNIKDKQSDLIPCLDIEKSNFDVMDYTLRFINRFKQLSNMDVCIYTYSSFLANFDSRLSNYKFWEANFNNNPFVLPGNNIWTVRAGHQYTDKGRISGINTNVDLNEFTQDILK